MARTIEIGLSVCFVARRTSCTCRLALRCQVAAVGGAWFLWGRGAAGGDTCGHAGSECGVAGKSRCRCTKATSDGAERQSCTCVACNYDGVAAALADHVGSRTGVALAEKQEQASNREADLEGGDEADAHG
eukprot:CAMPEP_0198121788 /NCGR_PEP_ID=MMETSP1442-20131203/33080_1 /TAXON_ID= /ORGANISM="Craspedostauros australis, Strain CCMP3328" /LENGTH=130 /DNA_ID=CAMNT_0043780665 /DNA_START=133 /DNA_END=525 /DNA_ORIENTATION=+